MDNKGKNIRQRNGPKVAPGLNDRKFGEDASKEDIKKGDSTKVTRLYLDENDPS